MHIYIHTASMHILHIYAYILRNTHIYCTYMYIYTYILYIHKHMHIYEYIFFSPLLLKKLGEMTTT